MGGSIVLDSVPDKLRHIRMLIQSYKQITQNAEVRQTEKETDTDNRIQTSSQTGKDAISTVTDL